VSRRNTFATSRGMILNRRDSIERHVILESRSTLPATVEIAAARVRIAGEVAEIMAAGGTPDLVAE
jgi:hypothetical protein